MSTTLFRIATLLAVACMPLALFGCGGEDRDKDTQQDSADTQGNLRRVTPRPSPVPTSESSSTESANAAPRASPTQSSPVPNVDVTEPPAQSSSALDVETATISAVAQITGLLRASPDLGDALGGVVRLAFHDAGSWDGSTGGADGCVDLGAAENAGLEPIIGQLAPVVASVSGVLSRADIWTLAGNVAVEMAGGPAMEFEVGRQDVESCEGHGVRLPNAELGQSHIRDVFLNRYGFSERDSAALMGAHVLGRAEPTFSGYTGSWVPQNDHFSNAYFRDLLGRPWRRQVLTSNGKTLTQWNGPGETMMLNTDIELAFDTATCNSAGGNGGRNSCPRATNAFSDAVTEFANGDGGEAAFHAAFAPAFKKLMALGRGNLSCALPDCRTPGVQGPGQGQGRPQTRGGEGGRGGRGR